MLHIASIVFLLYFAFRHIDRGNIGFAALQMNDALGLSAESVRLGFAALFTLALSCCFQALNAAAAATPRCGESRPCDRLACAGGLVSTSTAFVIGSVLVPAIRN